MIYFLLFFFLLSGCGSQDGEETPFVPPPSTQIESPEEPQNGGNPSTEVCLYHAESAKWVSIVEPIVEKRSEGNRHFAKGGSCIDKPFQEVWANSQLQARLKWHDAGIDGLRKLNSEVSPLYYEADYSAGPFISKQKWVMAFVHFYDQAKDPVNKVEIHYKKVRGTKYIPHWQGRVILQSLSTNVTSMIVENEIEIDMEKAVGGVTDLLSNFKE